MLNTFEKVFKTLRSTVQVHFSFSFVFIKFKASMTKIGKLARFLLTTNPGNHSSEN